MMDFLGYVSYIGQYAERDATLVQILYDAGAVPFVRTNVPQTLMVSKRDKFIQFELTFVGIVAGNV